MILVKGSRVFNFDLVSEALELKVHETILEVNLGAMVANLNHYRSMLRHPETKMICMVKASAYGAGSYEIAKSLQEHHVDYLAVAVVDEGSELRKAGITASIIIMDPELTAFKPCLIINWNRKSIISICSTHSSKLRRKKESPTSPFM